jgi:hypothetical protein
MPDAERVALALRAMANQPRQDFHRQRDWLSEPSRQLVQQPGWPPALPPIREQADHPATEERYGIPIGSLKEPDVPGGEAIDG